MDAVKQSAMQANEMSRLLLKLYSVAESSIDRHTQLEALKQEDKLRESFFKDNASVVIGSIEDKKMGKQIEKTLKAEENLNLSQAEKGRGNTADVAFSIAERRHEISKQMSFNVRLCKNTEVDDIARQFKRENIPFVEIVNKKDGMVAVFYSSLDEDKVQNLVNELQRQNASTVLVDRNALEKMNARRDNSVMHVINNMSPIEAKCFAEAARKYGITICQETEMSGVNTYVMSSDADKVYMAMYETAIDISGMEGHVFEKNYNKFRDTVEDISQKCVVQKEPFYVASEDKPDMYIKVEPDGYSIETQDDFGVKTLKSVAGVLNEEASLGQLAYELISFRNPVVLSEQEFSFDRATRANIVEQKSSEFKYNNASKDSVTETLTAFCCHTANELGLQVRNSADLFSNQFKETLFQAKSPKAQEVRAILGTLKKMDRDTIDNYLSQVSYKMHDLDEKLTQAEQHQEQERDFSSTRSSEEKE